MDKKIIGILLIAILAIVSTGSLSYYAASQPNQTQNKPSPTSTPTPSPSEEPTEPASIPTPSVPEFTVELVDTSYDVPTTYSTDPYTGETVTHEGYHVESRTIIVKIKNQPFVPYYDASRERTINFYFNIRIKGHFTEDWNELYSPEGHYIRPDSGAEYTVRTYVSGTSTYAIDTGSKRIEFPANATVDFQVEAMIGYIYVGPGYWWTTWAFEGERSGWSETQTTIIP